MTEQKLPLGLLVYANSRGKYGAEFDPNYCAASVAFGGRMIGYHQCNHKWKVEKRGHRWCGIHDPDKVEGRLKKSAARYEAQRNTRMAPYKKIERLEAIIVELLDVARMAYGLIETMAEHTDDLEVGSILALMKVREAAEQAISNAEEQAL